ncbi:MAG: ABC transporter ATP-binding protein [Bacilli bacterium]|nr:ABC transporter ATP-binding protein [Bacilli bacterium]
MKLIEMKHVYKTYYAGKIPTHALSNVSLDIEEGEIVVILGPSGGGKTTLLNCLSGLDTVTKGTITYQGKNITKMSDRGVTNFRKEHLGFIFQTYNLLEHLNVYENVLVGAKLGKTKADVNDIIKTVGLTKHKHKYMHELSGGEQQRVSIGRALMNRPSLLLCDEPTGNLDSKAGAEIINLLKLSNQKYKQTIIMITHDHELAMHADRIITIDDGKIIADEVVK